MFKWLFRGPHHVLLMAGPIRTFKMALVCMCGWISVCLFVCCLVVVFGGGYFIVFVFSLHFTHTHTHTHAHTRIYACLHIYINTYIPTYLPYIYSYLLTRTHICMPAFTHTHIATGPLNICLQKHLSGSVSLSIQCKYAVFCANISYAPGLRQHFFTCQMCESCQKMFTEI